MDGYVPNYIEEIKRRLPIVDVIGQRVILKKSGKNFKGLCPFHNENSGSFYVWPASESYYCFGCKASGDVFNFVMTTDGLSFGETLEQLAARAGVVLPERQAVEEDAETSARRTEKERLREANNAAATYYQHLLLNSQEGQAARDYLAKRGITQPSVESFGLGYALEGWDSLFKFLTNRGFTSQELVAAGLVGERENGGGFYDRFRGRLIFPIRDRQAQIIAFGGRTLEGAPKDSPKYLNSPQTTLFDKSATLYGLDLAKDGIRRSDRAVIVEGYVDVIMAHQHGYSNVVAPLGTALGEKHVGILKKLTKRIVLALDADTAGQLATLKGIEVMKQGFDSKTVPVPTARGLVRFEQQLDADIRIASLPAGKDPDEVVREGGGKWRELIEKALPVVDYYFASVGASVDLNSAKGKSEAVEQLIPAIIEVRDRIEREHYLQKLARLTQIEAELLRSELARAARAEARPRRETLETTASNDSADLTSDEINENEFAQPAPVKSAQPGRKLESEDFLLALLVRYPEALAIPAADTYPVTEADFIRSENRQLFAVLREGLPQFEESLNGELLGHLERLRAFIQLEPEHPDQFTVSEDLRFRLNRVRELNLRQLYEQGHLALDEPESDIEIESAELPDQEAIWALVSGVAVQLRPFYPRRSVVFKDSRDR